MARTRQEENYRKWLRKEGQGPRESRRNKGNRGWTELRKVNFQNY